MAESVFAGSRARVPAHAQSLSNSTSPDAGRLIFNDNLDAALSIFFMLVVVVVILASAREWYPSPSAGSPEGDGRPTSDRARLVNRRRCSADRHSAPRNHDSRYSRSCSASASAESASDQSGADQQQGGWLGGGAHLRLHGGGKRPQHTSAYREITKRLTFHDPSRRVEEHGRHAPNERMESKLGVIDHVPVCVARCA